MFEIKHALGHAMWDIDTNGTVLRWCELYDAKGAPISIEESEEHIYSVLIPFLRIVLSEIQAAPNSAILLRNLPAVLQYAKHFLP
jgi:hypothetical protein